MSEQFESPLISRRSFMLASTGLVAAGVLAACTPGGSAHSEERSTTGTTTESPIFTTTQPLLMGPDFSRYDALEARPDAANNLASGLLDAKKMAKAGLAFCAVRATVGMPKSSTQGATVREPNYDTMRRRLADAGLVTIAYHALTDSDPVKQADYFTEATNGATGIVPAVNFEQYQIRGEYHDLTRDMLQAFTERLLTNLADPKRQLVAYIPPWMWGSRDRMQAANTHKAMSAQESVMNNPPHVPGTVLWWGRQWRASEVAGGNLLMSPEEIAHAVRAEDQSGLWQRERLGTYTAPGFRQLLVSYRIKKSDGTFMNSGAKHQQFDGSLAGSRLRSLDWNICYMPHNELLGLAGLPAGSVPVPKASIE
ncbi:hypothetical protein IPP75_01805 [Candidatus Saccharibacteria bacterium]|nr:MAG: hypothetical protein IPP75_01805 [Candidatus Saccharibacteria bacterium]